MSQATASTSSGSQGSGSAAGTQVTILRADNDSSVASLNNITNSIRARAYQLAQNSGDSGSGDATRNWLQAERDLYRVPEATLAEDDQRYNIRISAAGLDSGNVEVIATSDAIIVRSTSTNNMNSSSGNIVYSDVDSRPMLRRFNLSSSIDNSQVSATMAGGVLTIAATKASAGSRRSAAAGA